MLISWASQQPAFRFSPLSLFAASEPGFWYDPSDISTLFQDAAGTTPVTAAGQSVGLMLDKSKGLVLGAELVTNGGFDSDTTGWASGSSFTSTAVASGGEMQVTATVEFGRQVQQVTTVAGRTYRVTGSVRLVSGSSYAYVAVGLGTEEDSVTPATAQNLTNIAKPFDFVFTATSTTSVISLSCSKSGSVGGFDNISVRELPGNHATQSTSLSRPTYQIDSNGRGYLSFDGSDDFLVTPTITPGTDKAQVFAGVRKLSDATIGFLAELSSSASANAGSWAVRAPGSNGVGGYSFNTRGSAGLVTPGALGYNAPITNVLTCIGDIAADTAIIRVNGVQAASDAADQGTGNYLAYPAYIGRRGGTLLPFNGRIYSLICRFGPNLTADQIAQTETWVNARTGAY